MKNIVKNIVKKNIIIFAAMIILTVAASILAAMPTGLLEYIFSDNAKKYLPVYATVAILFLFVNYMSYVVSQRFIYKTVDELETRLLDKILNLSNKSYQEIGNGALLNARANSFALANMFGNFTTIVSSIVTIVSIGVIVVIKMPIVLILIIIVSILIGIIYSFSKKHRKVINKTIQAYNIKQAGLFNDVVINNSTVKAYNGQDAAIKNHTTGRKELTSATLNGKRFSAKMSSMIEVISYIIPVALATYNIANDIHTYQSSLVIVMYATQLLTPVIRLIDTISSITTEGAALFDTINKVFCGESEVDNGSITLNAINNSIELKDVVFKYDESDLVLNGINMKIFKGQNIGIVGPSGAGKSSLIKLFNRVNNVTSGQILIDGIDINELTLNSLRAKVGVVSQRSECFDDTIMNNIRYGRPSATDEEVQKAAELANCTEFISKMPNGFNTNIGPAGTKLSGGQQQRINIARLFLLDPEVLILDEATSSLDNKSERLIKDAIEKLSGNRTVISIAHRLTTIQNCDKIFVINNHKVEAEGTYEELLETSHTFRELACDE